MYIQNLVKSSAIFCILLIIGLPISLAVEIVEPGWVEWVGPETGEEFVEGEWADFAINVKYYEPRPLTSSTIEKGNAPIYVHLAAMPAVPMSLPRVQSVSVREVGTRVLAGGIRYVRPTLYSWGDFGSLIVRLKQIPKEEDVPDTITANLTARFRYETEVMPGLIGGAIGKTLKKIEIEKLTRETEVDYWNRIWAEISGEEEHVVFRGKGYIIVKTISGEEYASFVLFNSVGEPRHIPAIRIGEERGPYSLVAGSREPEDFVRIRVDGIDKDKEEVTITLLAGVRRGESEVSFKLIIPVDKRPFDLTPQEIEKHIEWTNKTIEKLDKMIDELNKYVDQFYTACLISTGLVIVGQFFGIGRVATIGEKAGKTMKDILEEFPEKITKEEFEELSGGAILGITGRVTEKEAADLAEDWADNAELAAKEAKIAMDQAIVARDAGDVDAAQAAAKDAENNAKKAEAAVAQAEAAVKAVKEVATGITSSHVSRAMRAAIRALAAAREADSFASNAAKVVGLPYWTSDRAADKKEEPAKAIEATTGTVGNTINTDYFEGEKLIVVPIHDFSRLSSTLFPSVRELEKNYKNRIYASYNDKKGLTFFILEGREIDCGTKIGDDAQDTPITQTYGPGTSQFRIFSIEMGKVQSAQLSGVNKVNVFGSGYTIETKKILVDEAALNCEEFMSPGACKIIFNFCDPVMCPTSRCNFGGRYRLDKSVQESGLVASIFACMGNFPEVIVAVCLSGIRDSLENIKSYIQAYQNCLEIKLKEGRSVGFCDMARSVFICEIVWRHLLDPAFGYLSNKVLSRRDKGSGGGEYSRLGRAVESSKKATKYFVEGYAKQIVAAYKGKVSEAVGTELCRSAIVGKFPNFGEILKEIAEGGKPTQYTAKFEEHSYAAGTSRYFGYYHIHVGSKTETVNYAVYLKDCGEIVKLDVGQTGMIEGGNFVDETFEQIGPVGCKHICLVINGENYCAFGKVLSSSSAIEGLTEGYVARQAGKEITSERECVPSYEAYLAAAVNRQCVAEIVGSPGDNWVKVGVCREGVNCWAEIPTEDKGMKERIHRITCGEGKVCDRNHKCEGGTEVKILDSQDICCEGGKCVDKGFVEGLKALLPKYGEFGLNIVEHKLLDRWYDRGLKNTGNLDYYDDVSGISKLIYEKPDSVYYYIGMKFLYDADYENAEKCFEKISDKKSDYRINGIRLLGVAKAELGFRLYKEVTPGPPKVEETPSVITTEGLTKESFVKDLEQGDQLIFADVTCTVKSVSPGGISFEEPSCIPVIMDPNEKIKEIAGLTSVKEK